MFRFLIAILFCSNFCQAQLDSFPRINELSGQILILQNDSVIYFESFNDSLNQEVDYHYFGNLGAIYTYELIDILVEKNLIRKNDKVKKHLIQFPYSEMKIDHLLNHTSGLPTDYIPWFHRSLYRKPSYEDKPKSIENNDFIELIANEKPELKFAPGGDTLYSHINLILLQSIINSKLSEEEFNLYCSQRNIHPKGIYNPQNFSSGHVYIDSLTIEICNGLKDYHMPYEDHTFGHQGYFGLIDEFIINFSTNQYRSKVQWISEVPGYNIEYHEWDDLKVFFFLNMESQQDYLTSDLLEFIRNQILK